MLGRTERQREETSTRPRDRPGGDAWTVPTLRPSIPLAGVNHLGSSADLVKAVVVLKGWGRNPSYHARPPGVVTNLADEQPLEDEVCTMRAVGPELGGVGRRHDPVETEETDEFAQERREEGDDPLVAVSRRHVDDPISVGPLGALPIRRPGQELLV